MIKFYYKEHNPPHFHAEYGSQKAQIDIHTLEIIEGKLPAKAYKYVVQWAKIHKKELLQNWEFAVKHEDLKKIKPLE